VIATGSTGARGDRWRFAIVAACSLCLVGESIGTYVFAPLLKPVVGDLGWSRTEFTLSGLWLSLAMMAAVPVAGMLTDRGRARPVLAFGALCLGASMYLFGRMRALGQFYAITALMGLGVGCVGGIPVTALVSRWFATERGLALALVGFGHSLGGLVVPPVATWITLADSWRAAFRAFAGFVWLVVLPVTVLVVRDAPAAPSGPSRAPDALDDRIPFRDGVRSSTFWLLSAAMFLHVLYFAGVSVHFVAFATDVGFGPEKAARAFGVLLGLGIVGRLVFGWAADRFGRRGVMIVALGLTVVAALCLQRITAPGVLPAFVLVHGLSVAGAQTVFGLVVAECFGALNVGTFLGATMLFQVPGGVAGAILAAASWDRLGTYAPAFWLFAAGNLVATGTMTLVRPYARTRRPTTASAEVAGRDGLAGKAPP
jgi:sugar phosphate permease